jgi:CBS domain-containing protein
MLAFKSNYEGSRRMSVSHILAGKGHRVVTLPASTTILDVSRYLAENRIGAIIISGPTGAIEGIVSERDIVKLIATDGHAGLEKPVSDIMTKSVKTCAESDSEADLMKMMTANRIRHLPVVKDTKLVGIISIGDVVKYRIEGIEREAEEMKAYIASAG